MSGEAASNKEEPPFHYCDLMINMNFFCDCLDENRKTSVVVKEWIKYEIAKRKTALEFLVNNSPPNVISDHTYVEIQREWNLLLFMKQQCSDGGDIPF